MKRINALNLLKCEHLYQMAINTSSYALNREGLILTGLLLCFKIPNWLLRISEKVIDHAEEICKIEHGGGWRRLCSNSLMVFSHFFFKSISYP